MEEIVSRAKCVFSYTAHECLKDCQVPPTAVFLFCFVLEVNTGFGILNLYHQTQARF